MTSDRLSDLCVLHFHGERVNEDKTKRILAKAKTNELLNEMSSFQGGNKLKVKLNLLINFDFDIHLCANPLLL